MQVRLKPLVILIPSLPFLCPCRTIVSYPSIFLLSYASLPVKIINRIYIFFKNMKKTYLAPEMHLCLDLLVYFYFLSL